MTTAKILRQQYEDELQMLQALCKHESSEVMASEWAPGHSNGTVKVCKNCDKVLVRYDGGSVTPNKGRYLP